MSTVSPVTVSTMEESEGMGREWMGWEGEGTVLKRSIQAVICSLETFASVINYAYFNC